MFILITKTRLPLKKSDTFIVSTKAIECVLHTVFCYLDTVKNKLDFLYMLDSFAHMLLSNFDIINTDLLHVDANWLIKGRFIAKSPAAGTEAGESGAEKASISRGYVRILWKVNPTSQFEPFLHSTHLSPLLLQTQCMSKKKRKRKRKRRKQKCMQDRNTRTLHQHSKAHPEGQPT